jgi:hypothetical protein
MNEIPRRNLNEAGALKVNILQTVNSCNLLTGAFHNGGKAWFFRVKTAVENS